MRWTYDPAMASDRDKVRFRLGDTVEAAPLLQDEEIDVLLEGSDVISATIACAESLAMHFASLAQSKTDDIGQSVNYGDRSARYRALADRLRANASRLALPFAGGISHASKDAITANADRVAPAFTRELHDTSGSV